MHINIIRTKVVNDILKDLNQDYVFVGGAIVSLYASKTTSESLMRPTDDVDVIVELASYSGYAALDQKLQELGFRNDIMSGVICRYQVQGITVDVMPTDPEAIGFSNKWYPEGFQTAIEHQIDKDAFVKIFTLPCFIASKWEAFKSRGDDYRSSTDFEDLVYVFENATDFKEKINMASAHLKLYLKEEFGAVLYTEDFNEGLASHMAEGYHSPTTEIIKDMLSDSFNIDPPNYRGYTR